MRLFEIDMPKRQWTTILSQADKHEVGQDLVGLVQGAYATTNHGSFVNSIKDVLPSEWEVFDWDDDTPGIDSAIFYRKSNGSESWNGKKIQGLGHDGQQESKRQAVQRLQKMLNTSGTWIEASGAVRAVLLKGAAHVVTDQRTLRKLFADNSLKMIDKNTYTRRLGNGKTITQSVFGLPSV